MVECLRCRQLPNHAYIRSLNERSPATGDIYGVKTSLVAPLEKLLELNTSSSNVSVQPSTRMSRSRSSFTGPYSSAGTTGSKMYSKGNRPCLIVTYSGKGQDTVDTCVMGNLEGRNIDSMPLVFRHFCIPVAPNFGPNRTHMDVHIHTVPDWDARLGKAQWLITLPHALPAYMFRKKWTGAKRRSHHCVDADMISTLHRIRDQKDEEWSRWSKDPNFLSNARKEYKEHQAAHRNGRAQASLRTNSEVSLPTSFGRDSLDPVSEELLEEGAVEAILGLEGSCATMATQGAAPLAETPIVISASASVTTGRAEAVSVDTPAVHSQNAGGDSNKDEARGISPTPSQQTVVDELSAASAPVTEPRKS
ncbi:uncharacterized protein C8Q71DRAFT_442880 [Rhodofomes roseus]|uniref:Uncharacterized protein n=1 Tax=Rhodofomes roseus TaxID=34475 RepID=A0ABQ8JZM0_9APHY|nr:uncharacterized protein C8Q71DRAFT_442880 [Rhodofomes roseus]KAH9829223.1 hypothetical protein C8Q71DRAFT_442880 [Rhodofomes roseus]